MGLLTEFREFAVKGNAIDLAVGVILGAAFGKIVSSLVDDVIMPPIGKAVGNVDFSNLYVSLSDKVDALNAGATRVSLAEAKAAGAVLAYGNFITILINFLIVAFCIFLIVKVVNMARRKPEPAPAAPPAPTREETLLMEIRDAIRGGNR